MADRPDSDDDAGQTEDSPESEESPPADEAGDTTPEDSAADSAARGTEPSAEPDADASRRGGPIAALRARPWLAGIAGVGAIAAVVAIVFALTTLGGDDDEPVDGPDVQTEAVTIEPSGQEVSRLAPIVIRFKDAPDEQEPDRLVSLTPAVDGSFVWSEDRRTLLYQPDFPGLTRGGDYLVRVDGSYFGLDADFTEEFTVEGQLAVDYLIPGDGDREVPAGAPILVQFNRAVVPLTLISELDTSTVLTFEPAVSGEGEWLSTSLYRFQPDALAPSTDYTVTVRQGLTSAVDGSLEEAVTWSFRTISPGVSEVVPGQNTQYVPRDQQIVVTFNQPMSPASVEEGFALLDEDAEPVAGSFAWDDEDLTVTFTPDEVLALGARYEVRVPAGLASATGGDTVSERQVAFQTAPEATVVRTSPQDGDDEASRWGIEIQFAAPIDVDTLDGRISVSGIDSDDLQIDSWDAGASIYISNRLEPDTDYTVALATGALDRQGLPVPPFSFSFTTGSLPPSVSLSIPHGYATYAATTNPELFFFATNVDEVPFELYELSEVQARSRMADPWREYTPGGDPIRTWTVPIEGVANTPRLTSTLLGDGAPLPPGDYFLRTNVPFQYNPNLTFSVVNVAIVTKLADRELLVWALDYTTGEPLDGVTVVANGPRPTGAFNSGEMTATTDDQGLASFEVPTDIDVSGQGRGRDYAVRIDDGDHYGVSHTSWQRGSEPWQIDIPLDYSPRTYVGHLYTDRPIYRPGETVSLKGVVRADDDADYSVPDEPPPGLELIIRGPDYEEIETRLIDLNEYGTFAEEFELPSEADVGFYQLELLYDQSSRQTNWYLTSVSFSVAEFRVPEFQVEASASPPDVIDGELIEVDAAATFFFGGGVGNAEVEWTAFANPTSFHSEAFPDYSFNDFDYWATSVVEDRLRGTGSSVTDATGNASFTLPAELRGNEGTQSFDINVSVQDESAQVVAASTAVTVHPAALYAGVRPEGYLAVEGEATTIDLVTVDLDGEPLANRDVVLQVYEREWVTTKEETSGGGRFYRSEPVDTLVATIPATTDENAEATVTYVPEQPGTLRFVVEVTDAQGRIARASRFMWVTGGNFVRWQVRNDDVFELVADRESYEPGDTAEILVPTSYPGARALVTQERAHIIDRETRVLETASDVISVPIVDRHVPNVFVSVVLYRPPTDEDPVPRYQLGYVELPVSTESRQLVVDVTPSEERAGPGDTVEYEIQVTDLDGVGVQSELSIAVVDEAVLSLADERGVDGLRAFWFERGLAVRTASSVSVSIDRTNDVIQEPEEGGKGGGSDSEALRSEFRNTAYWDGQVETDASGRATIEVPLPDNLTTWRASVRAISGDTMVGDGVAELLVTRPLLARPALPRFLRVGDDVTVRVLMRNGTETTSEVTVALDIDGIEVDAPGAQTHTVAPGASVEFAWPAHALSAGEARIRFTGTDQDGLTDAVELTIPVLLGVTPEATATGGVVTDAPAVEAVYLPDYALVDDGRLEVSVQASLVGVLNAESKHFSIPTCGRACESTTTIASRIIAYGAMNSAEGEASQARSIITRGDVTELESRQRSDGGWSWCAGTCPSNPSVTAWTLIALTEAQRDGYEVSQGRLDSGRSYLNRALAQATDVEAENDASWRAMIQYAMVRVTPTLGTSQVRALFEQERSQLQNWGRAFMILALMERSDDTHNEEVIEALINDLAVNAISSANGSHWEDPRASDHLQSDLRTTALVLRAMSAAAPDHPLIEETVRWLVVARSAGGWETRVERATALDALAAYAEATGELLGDFEYAVSIDDDELLAGEFQPRGGENAAEAEAPLADLTLGGFSRVLFDRDTDAPGRLYYALNLLYQTPAQEVESLNRGIAVSREFTLLEDPDTPISNAPLGEIVRVRLTVLSDADRKFVTLADALPAGLEPIDPQLKIVPAYLVEQLNEERREAILGDAPEYAAPWFPWYLSPWDDVQVRDEELVMFASRLPRGVHEYVFFARATTPGDFFVAPAVAQEAFFPEVFGRSDSSRFTVEPGQ